MSAIKLEINTTWFKDRIITKHLSQRKLAKVLDLDPAAVSLMLRGRRHIRPDEAEKLAIELGVPVGDVLENMGVDMTAGAQATAIVAGKVMNDGKVVLGRVEGPRRVPVPSGMPEGCSALRFQGEGFSDGWLAFYVPEASVDAECVGRLAIIQVAGSSAWYLRVLRRGYHRGTYTLVDTFAKELAIESVKVASAVPVLWIRTF